MVVGMLVRLAGVSAVLLVAAPAGAKAPDLASYRVVYDLAIDDTSDAGGSATVSGRLAMEFTASRCGDYRTRMRFVTEGDDGDGTTQVTDSRSETLETADGRFEFDNQTYSNDVLAEESKGVAMRGPQGVKVVLTRPSAKTFTIAEPVFYPTEQLKKIMATAAAGRAFRVDERL